MTNSLDPGMSADKYAKHLGLFEIRRAVQPDAEVAADVWLRSRRDARDVIPVPVHSDEEIRGWMATRVLVELECWVAEAPDRTVVGLLVLEGNWIDQLYVLPGWQGRGVGSTLLEHAMRLRADGLQLWTFASKPRGCRFYERRGFVAVQETDGADNEEHAPDVRYVWAPNEQGAFSVAATSRLVAAAGVSIRLPLFAMGAVAVTAWPLHAFMLGWCRCTPCLLGFDVPDMSSTLVVWSCLTR